MNKLGISDLDLKGRRVFMRVDFNVPLADGQITDDTRIQAALPSIRYVIEKNGKLILASHLGRPKGKPDPKYSLKPVATRLGNLLRKAVQFAPDCVGPEVDKIDLIESFINIANNILVGGAMAYTFLRGRGIATGKSLVESEKIALAKDLLAKASTKNVSIELPVDHVVAPGLESAASQVISITETPPDQMGLDIGPETIRRYSGIIRQAKTIVWNGPIGVFENPKFASGTFAIARAVADSNAYSIVGGGDSAAAVAQSGVGSKITHISTGGGASLEFFSGQKISRG